MISLYESQINRIWADTKEYHHRIKAEIRRFSVSSIISIIGEKELLKGMDGKYGEGEQVLFFISLHLPLFFGGKSISLSVIILFRLFWSNYFGSFEI